MKKFRTNLNSLRDGRRWNHQPAFPLLVDLSRDQALNKARLEFLGLLKIFPIRQSGMLSQLKTCLRQQISRRLHRRTYTLLQHM